MYLDAANLIPSGKFVFFAWGDKISSKEFPYINDYARFCMLVRRGDILIE